jgi:anti-sigma regulatory factor (Ser/Thr protein kinase)
VGKTGCRTDPSNTAEEVAVLVSRTVRHTAASAALVRRELTADLRTHGVDETVIDNAALLVSELVGNSVRHAHPLPGDVIRIDWDIADESLTLHVADGGGRNSPELRDAGPEDTRGRGLAIVGAFASEWGFDRAPDGSSTVWARLPVGAAVGRGEQAGGARDRGPRCRSGNGPGRVGPGGDEPHPRWFGAAYAPGGGNGG